MRASLTRGLLDKDARAVESRGSVEIDESEFEGNRENFLQDDRCEQKKVASSSRLNERALSSSELMLAERRKTILRTTFCLQRFSEAR